jgi:hypothetical protein
MRALMTVGRKWRRWRFDRRLAFRPHATEGDVVDCSPAFLVSRQYVDGECLRLDLFVRTLAAAEFAGVRTGGAELYTQYRKARPSELKSVAAFARLFERIAQDGFAPHCPIDVAQDASILDGAHRLACAMVLDMPSIPLRIVRMPWRFYAVTSTWFAKNGFSADDLARLEQEAERFRRRLADH